jgi:hypothetical protein
MKALAVGLMACSLAGVAWAQQGAGGSNSQSSAPPDSGVSQSNASQSNVIVPWRHFSPNPQTAGAKPAASSNGQMPQEVIQQPVDDPPSTTNDPVISGGDSNSGAEAANATGDAAGGTMSVTLPAPKTDAAATRVEELESNYHKREQSRDSQRAALEQVASKDPSLQALAEIQSTRLLLEGEQDRSTSGGELADGFAQLSASLKQRADQVDSLIADRSSKAGEDDEEAAKLQARIPQIKAAMRNLATLTASGANNTLLERLDNELADDQTRLAKDVSESRQARAEMTSLQKDKQKLLAASQQAAEKSAEFAKVAQAAQQNQGRLADHLEYSVSRERAREVLDSTSSAINNSSNLTANMGVNAVLNGGAHLPTGKSDAAIARLRDCIRKSGDVSGCQAKEGGIKP